MPFYQILAKTHKQNKIKKATLQTRTLSRTNSVILKSRHGKKASLSASLTLEAALVLSLFLFSAVCLILPMKVMNTERRMQAVLERTGEDYSRYGYLLDAVKKGNAFEIQGAGDFAKSFCKYLADGAAQEYARAQVLDVLDSHTIQKISAAESQVMLDGESIDLILNYRVQLPFPVLGMPALKRSVRCRRRAWIGLPGKNYGEGGQDDENPEDRIVYIGKNSTRYHLSRSCHYLSNDLSTLTAADLETARNRDGSRYRPCAVCGKRAASVFYCMPSGDCYHTDPDCSAIQAYVRAVKLSEVKELGACSYCGK